MLTLHWVATRNQSTNGTKQDSFHLSPPAKHFLQEMTRASFRNSASLRFVMKFQAASSPDRKRERQKEPTCFLRGFREAAPETLSFELNELKTERKWNEWSPKTVMLLRYKLPRHESRFTQKACFGMVDTKFSKIWNSSGPGKKYSFVPKIVSVCVSQ